MIDEATRQQLIAEDPKSADLIKPWLRGRDIRKWKTEWAGLYLSILQGLFGERPIECYLLFVDEPQRVLTI